ncbi:unnamed protein product [Adineta ricciae]|uniref:Uncharacterized protein n=1 Tax=Adineta ricciae TaxID=249248 RepID=A0A815VP27_ADIRI|nr:unnamed protein product [Adineta ricciae]
MIKKSSIFNGYVKQQRNLSKQKRDLIQDVRTRWNSTFLIIHSLKILRPIIKKLFRDKHVLTKNRKQLKKFSKLELTSSEWNYLEELWKVLRSFYSATKTISGRNYCTIGAAFFILMKLKGSLSDDQNDILIVKRLKKLLLAKFIHYYEQDRDQLNILKFHAYFDPLSHSLLSESDKRAVEQRVKQTITNGDVNTNSQSSTTAPTSLSAQASARSPIIVDVVNSTTTSTGGSGQKKKVAAMEAFLMTIGDTAISAPAATKRASIVEEIYNY